MITIMTTRAVFTAALLAGVLSCGGDDPTQPGVPARPITVVGGGDNAPDRYSSDLWVHGDYAYTGTWGARAGTWVTC